MTLLAMLQMWRGQKCTEIYCQFLFKKWLKPWRSWILVTNFIARTSVAQSCHQRQEGAFSGGKGGNPFKYRWDDPYLYLIPPVWDYGSNFLSRLFQPGGILRFFREFRSRFNSRRMKCPLSCLACNGSVLLPLLLVVAVTASSSGIYCEMYCLD